MDGFRVQVQCRRFEVPVLQEASSNQGLQIASGTGIITLLAPMSFPKFAKWYSRHGARTSESGRQYRQSSSPPSLTHCEDFA